MKQEVNILEGYARYKRLGIATCKLEKGHYEEKNGGWEK